MRRAAAAALSAVVTRRPAVERLRQNRQPRRDARDAQLVGGLLDQQLVAARLRRRLEDAVRLVRNAFIRAEDADEAIELVVVGLDAAEHAAAKPVERGAGRVDVRFSLEVPAADAAVEFTERFIGCCCAAAWRLVGPYRHLRVLGGVPHAAGLEHHDVRAGVAQDLGGHAAARARADDADVVGGWLTNDLHSASRNANLRPFCDKFLLRAGPTHTPPRRDRGDPGRRNRRRSAPAGPRAGAAGSGASDDGRKPREDEHPVR